MKKSLLSMTLLLMGSILVFAQEEQTKQEDYYELSLEDLMNIPINSASKKDETLFDAPLSSYTITKSDIEKSGATSIMEALRMAPGVIVREQANGVYDIHIRGFDNLLGYSSTFSKANLSTLVMINDRPVFNNNLGGTFWEALTIDLNDVERIEIVRGPSAPLFGPNAVTGVINIITKKFTEKKQVSASLQYGVPNSLIGNASVGSKLNDRFSIGASANYQKKERFDDTYYNYATETYGATPTPALYPDQAVAMDKYGVNAFALISPSEKVSFDLSLGAQESQIQKAFIGTQGNSPLTTNITRSQTANLLAKVYNFTLRTSFLNGKDNLNYNSTPNRYDQQVFDFTAEYNIKVHEKISIVPGLSYQTVSFDDSEYTEGLVFLGGQKVSINTSSAFLRTDIKPIDKLRIIGAVRADKFSTPDDTYFAYEVATTYKINDKNLVRAAITQSNSGSFIGNNYLNLVVPNQFVPQFGLNVNYYRLGNQNMKLFTVNMVEVGFRSQLSKSFQLDVDLFSQKADNMNALVLKGPDGTFTDGRPNIIEEFSDIKTTASQVGATLSLNIVPSENIQIKPFLTVQKTELENAYSVFNNSSAVLGNRDHENTPGVYGGYYLNVKAGSKWNINSSAYFFSAHRQYDVSDLDNNSTAGDIKGKALLNLKVNYSLTQEFSVFVNARNILASSSQEFFGTDKTGGMILGGLSVNLK